MTAIIVKQRLRAAAQQGGLCYYCQLPLCEERTTDLASFAAVHNITTKQARRFLCTAEHLLPKSDGGGNHPGNIVAACFHCNTTRHRRRKVLSSEDHRARVRGRLERQRWHPAWALGAMLSKGMHI